MTTYTKLISLLSDAVFKFDLISIGPKLTNIKECLDKAVFQRTRSYSVQHHDTDHFLESMTEVQGLRYLQELIATQQVQNALSLLHIMRYKLSLTNDTCNQMIFDRRHYRDEHLFGSDQSDDVDVLVFAFAHFIAEGGEGKTTVFVFF